jgi:hypothetical protein
MPTPVNGMHKSVEITNSTHEVFQKLLDPAELKLAMYVTIKLI